jgi:signal transduction histidine kinase/ActR/RegA family two-component response regulator
LYDYEMRDVAVLDPRLVPQTGTRTSGLRGLGEVPWGSHLCQFYRSKADLIETLVPYFVAGLELNERCIWIASEPLGAADCWRQLEARVPDLAERARRGQIEIMDYADWYTRGDALDGASTLRRWLDAEAEARQNGYAGLRLTGNTFALDQKDWAAFSDYEASVQATFHNRRIIALCSYCRDRCSADEIIDVIRNHDCALVRREGDWEAVHSAGEMVATFRAPPAAAPAEHVVHFYAEGEYPAEAIARFVAGALRSHQGVLLPITQEHRRQLARALDSAGIDLTAAIEAGQAVVLDANEMLADIAPDGDLDEDRLQQTLVPVLDELAGRFAGIRACGEVVDLLVRAGRIDTAARLEQALNRHMETRSFPFLCTYSSAPFEGHLDEKDVIADLCGAHDEFVGVDGDDPDAPPHLELLADLARRRRQQLDEAELRRQLDLKRSHLYAAQQRARERATLAARQLTQVQGITSALSEAAEPADIGRVVVDEMGAVARADHALLVVVARDGTLELLGSAGPAAATLMRFAGFVGNPSLPIQTVLESGAPLWLPNRDAIATRFPELAAAVKQIGSLLCLPLAVGPQQLGAIGFAYNEPCPLDGGERTVLEELSRQVALALERARLYQDARTRRDHLQLLADVSAHFSAARHEPARVLAMVVEELTRSFADASAVTLRTAADDTVELAAARHVDDEMAARICQNDADAPREAQPGAAQTLISAPLRAGGECIGRLWVARRTPNLPFSSEERDLLGELADRVALAIENARLYERAQRDREQAEAANRAKDEFLAMLGHELRNPLSPILTALDLMRLRAPDVLVHERTVVQRQLRHMVRLVDDLLDVSRITRGKIELKRSRVEMMQVVAEAIESVSPLIEERGHQLKTDVPLRGLAVDGDAHRLAQAVANLLTNAAKYTPPGGHIEVQGDVTDGVVRIRVRDDGVGIPPELRPRIFDLFVQGRQTANRSEGGLGLGLTIVRSLVELHGGSVDARSQGPGRGSEFEIRLPPAPPLPSQAGARGDDLARRDAQYLVTRTARPLRLLIVDDNADAALLLSQLLASIGHVTRVAHDGPTALGIALEFHPDVALLDIGLPVMDGHELGQRLSALLHEAPPKLIAVSGYGQDSDRERSRAAGFLEHLVKPIDVDGLEPVLQGVVAGAARASR